MQKLAGAGRPQVLFYLKEGTLRFVMLVSLFFIALIILTANLLRAGDGFGQGMDKTISLELHNESLRNALNKIEELSGYHVAYVVQEIAIYNNINLQKEKRTVKKTLELLLSNTHLAFKQEESTILIYNRERPTRAFDGYSDKEIGLPAMPPISIKGQVINEKKEPLVGASVKIKGTLKGTATDNKGKFTIQADSGQILIISFVGYDDREIMVSSDKSLTIQLELSLASLLNTVVVSTGYQKVSKERFVGSVTTIDSALFNRSVSTGLLSRLDGITNGLLFDKRTNPSNPKLQIRGISTLSGSGPDSNMRKPLIVLDNFPYTGDINSINPNDVENITILKDAVAASIWGAQAGNGVIVITTKRGSYNQSLRVSYKYSVNLTEKPDLFYYPKMETADFIDVEQFLFSKGHYDANLNSSSHPVISPVVEILAKQRAGQLSQEEAEEQINVLKGLDVRNDYDKYVYREAISQQHYLGLSGGTSAVKYALSLGYDNNQSQYQGNGAYKRYTINSNTTFKPYKFLELNAGINFSQSISKGGGFSYDATLYPYTQLADSLGNPIAVSNTYRLAFIDTVGGGKLLDWHYRPLEEMYLSDNLRRIQSYTLNVGASLRITSWLSGDIQYQYLQEGNDTRTYNSIKTYGARTLINRYYNPTAPTERLKYPIPLGGILNLSNSELVSQNFRGQLNLNKSWNSKHAVTALIATDIKETSSKSNRNLLYGYDDETLGFSTNINYDSSYQLYLGGSARIPSGLALSETIDHSVSLTANASYTYNNRYSVYGSARKDATNVFGINTNNRWKPLWSVGGSWDISKELFYRLNWLPSLRFRASYGYTGNVNNTITALATIGYGPLSPFTGTPAARLGGPPNPDLRWEEVGILNLGIDFTLLKNRLSGSIEWFQKKSKDIISDINVDETLGLFTVLKNAANLKGKGIDISVRSNNLRGPLQWNTSFNFSHTRIIVTKFYQILAPSIPEGSGINPRVGEIAWGLYSYRWAGLDPLTGDPQGYLNGHVSKNYIGITEDSLQHQVFHGSSIPLYFGNILNSFSWKGFSLSFNISYRLAFYYRKPSLEYASLYLGKGGHLDYLKRWQQPGDEQFTTVPSMQYPLPEGRDDFYRLAEVNVARGDNIRLQDIRFGFPSWESKNPRSPVKRIDVYLYPGNINILLWKSDKSGLDPDYSGDIIHFPPSRTWAAGINVSFK